MVHNAVPLLLVSLALLFHRVHAQQALFYLVGSNQNSSANLLPLRPSGSNEEATFTGSVPPGQFYINSGSLFVTPADPTDIPPHAFIASIPNAQGCSPYGGLVFTVGFPSDKCARTGTFTLLPNTQNPQFGEKLVFQGVGGFYACGSTLDVWYEPKPGAGPPDTSCGPIDLYTVPVV